MTAPMTMNRVIHAAVRRDLDRLSAALASFPDGDRGRARDLQRAYAHLQDELTRHHQGEDTHIWPMLLEAGVAADLLDTMEHEHQALAEGLAETATAMSRLAGSGAAADAAAARESVLRTRAVVNDHFDHEERELEPQLQPHLESPEWKAVEKKLRSEPPGVAGRFFAWVTDGMSPEHRAYFRSAVPPPVVFLLSRVFGRGYYRDVAPVWKAKTTA